MLQHLLKRLLLSYCLADSFIKVWLRDIDFATALLFIRFLPGIHILPGTF